MNKKTNRRSFLGRGAAAAAAAVAVAGVPAKAAAQAAARQAAQPADKPVKKVHYRNGTKPEKTPLFNSTVSYGNLLFIAGVGLSPGRGHQGPHEGRPRLRSSSSWSASGRRWTRS